MKPLRWLSINGSNERLALKSLGGGAKKEAKKITPSKKLRPAERGSEVSLKETWVSILF